MACRKNEVNILSFNLLNDKSYGGSQRRPRPEQRQRLCYVPRNP